MMSDATEKAEQYHNQFQNALTDDARQALSSAYKAYYARLSHEQKAEADQVHTRYFAETRRMIDAMEPTLQRANEMLRQHQVTAHTTESIPRR